MSAAAGPSRARGVVGLLLGAGVLWLVGSQTWSSTNVDAATSLPQVASSAGEQSATSPVLVACAAVIALCALLVAMLRTVGRWVMCAIAALAAAGYAVQALVTITRGQAVTAWPWVGLVAGLAVIAWAAYVAVRTRSVPASHRFERGGALTAEDGSLDPASAWDALSAGEDPSEAADARVEDRHDAETDDTDPRTTDTQDTAPHDTQADDADASGPGEDPDPREPGSR